MTTLQLIELLAASLLGSALNATAGGGSLVVLPALLSVGVSPILANATTTFALWPGSIAGLLAYRKELLADPAPKAALIVASLLGAWVGATLLMHTSDQRFMQIVPVLLLAAAVILTVGPYVQRWLAARNIYAGLPAWPAFPHYRIAVIAIAQFGISIYGGYFGGGMGIIIFSVLTLSGRTHIHQMIAVRVLLSSVIHAVAVGRFIYANSIAWNLAPLMVLASVLGGFVAARLARRLPATWFRATVIIVSWGVTGYVCYRALRA